MNAILERALEKVRSAKRRISEAVKATNSAEEESELSDHENSTLPLSSKVMEEMTSEAVWRLLKLTSKTVRIPRVETSCVAAAAGTNRVESANRVESMPTV